MANPKGNVDSLRPYRPQWRSGKTQVIRVPIALANQLLEIAHQIDMGELPTKPEGNRVELTQIERVIADVLSDSAITRNGKDGGAVKRALSALKTRLEGTERHGHPPDT